MKKGILTAEGGQDDVSTVASDHRRNCCPKQAHTPEQVGHKEAVRTIHCTPVPEETTDWAQGEISDHVCAWSATLSQHPEV